MIDYNYSNYMSNSALGTSAFASSPLNSNGFVSNPVNSGVTATGIYNPSGSAYSKYQPYYNPYLNSLLNPMADAGVKPDNQGPTAQNVAWSPVAPSTIDYLNADIAKHYGMSKETAYQEALANTSYQRAIKDMQSAGLNPAAIFGAGKGSGADGVSYVSSASGSGGVPGSARKVAEKNENLFSSGAYYGLSAGVGLLVSILTKSPTGYWIGSQATQGFLGAMNSAYKNQK